MHKYEHTANALGALTTKQKLHLTGVSSLNYRSELQSLQRLSLVCQNAAPLPSEEAEAVQKTGLIFSFINWSGKRPMDECAVNIVPWVQSQTMSLSPVMLHWQSQFNLYTC